MPGENKTYKHAEVTQKIIGAFYDVYNELGFGFLESVYAKAIAYRLKESGIHVESQVPVPVWYHGHLAGDFHAALVIEGKVIVEIRAGRVLEPFDEAQMLNYLKATDIEIGLLLNFGPKPEIKRLAFDNDRKRRKPEMHGATAS